MDEETLDKMKAIFIPHRCPKCFENVTLIQPMDKKDMPKGKAQGHCVFCGWREGIEMYPAPKPIHLNFKEEK